MRQPTLIRLAGFVALSAAAASSFAADPGHPCAVVTDDSQRLACYDVAFGKPARTTPAAAVAPAPAAAAVAVVPAAPVAPAVAPPAATPPPAPVAAPAAPAKAVVPQGPLRVTAVAEVRGGRHMVTLEGGARWVQIEKDNAFQLAAGETVTLRDGALGSVFLVTPAGVRVRVRPAE